MDGADAVNFMIWAMERGYAIWDIWRKEDLPKVRKIIRKVDPKRWKDADPILSIDFYIDSDLGRSSEWSVFAATVSISIQ